MVRGARCVMGHSPSRQAILPVAGVDAGGRDGRQTLEPLLNAPKTRALRQPLVKE